MTDRILVGAFAGAFGVRGEVRLKSFCAKPEAVGDYGPLWTEDGSRSFDVRLIAPIPQGFSARVAGVSTREAAEALKGIALFAERDRLPRLPDDEFYHADLIGLDVVDTGGAAMGKVRSVLNHGAGDILEVYVPGNRQTLLLPFTRRCVPMVDLAARRLVADPPAEVEE